MISAMENYRKKKRENELKYEFRTLIMSDFIPHSFDFTV